MRALIVGISGVMGRATALLSGKNDFYAVAGCDEKIPITCADNVDLDVIIEFATAQATPVTLKYAAARAIPAVIGTTGHTDVQCAAISDAAKTIPVFYDSNFSLGMAALAAAAVKVSAFFPECRAAIIETHRVGKKDAPGGSAKKLRSALGGNADIFSVRTGDEKGRHDIVFALDGQTVVLTHHVLSRSVFARGAVEAARFTIGKAAGIYTMEDIVRVN